MSINNFIRGLGALFPDSFTVNHSSCKPRLWLTHKAIQFVLFGGIVLFGSGSSLAAQSPAVARREPLIPGGVSPHPMITAFQVNTQQVTIQWSGPTGPFQIESQSGLQAGQWNPVGEASFRNTLNLPAQSSNRFFRVLAPSPRFAGAAVCAQCHRAVHTKWDQTHHARALETLKAIRQDANSTCLPCHTVGYGLPTGFQDEAATPHLAGVQCENCHGPAADHVVSPFDIKPVVRLDSEMCGGCHTGFHHATYDEWLLSRHARAAEGLRHYPFARQECLQCHSEDYRYASTTGVAPPTVAQAKHSVECATCHESHGDTIQASLLRKPVIELCGECHTQGETLLGQSPHHPQAEMLKGIGAFNAEGDPMINVGPHALLVEINACAQCHVIKHQSEDPTAGNPNVTGHTFNPFDVAIQEHQAAQYTGCLECHISARAAERARTTVQQEISQRLQELAPYFTPTHASYLDPANLSEADQQQLRVANFNYEFVRADGSLGVHNSDHARAALGVAETIVRSLQP